MDTLFMCCWWHLDDLTFLTRAPHVKKWKIKLLGVPTVLNSWLITKKFQLKMTHFWSILAIYKIRLPFIANLSPSYPVYNVKTRLTEINLYP